MASIIRPNVLRQVCSKRVFSTQNTIIPAASKSITSRPAILGAFARQSLPSSVRVAAFHASGKQAILPPPRQTIVGTVNDAAVVPPADASHGSYHWTFERLISVGLIPLTIAPFAAGSLNPVTDAILCATLIIHSHIGFDSCIVDYFPTRQVPKTRVILSWVLRVATLGVGVGLYEFETNDVGITEALKRIWKA